MSFKKDISKIRKLNNKCADCNSINPSWASVNIGILLCQRCCIFHRKMGVHISRVKSTTLDNWNSKYINYLKQNGNVKMNKIYEAKLSKRFKPNSETSEYDLYEFIKNKYQHKLYFSRSVKKKLEKKLEKKKIIQTIPITPMISPQKISSPKIENDKIADLIDFESLFISDETKPINNENLNVWETFGDLEDIFGNKDENKDENKVENKDENKVENKVENKQSNDLEKITSLFKSSQYSWQQNQQPNFYRQNTYPIQQNQQPNFYRQNTYPIQQNQNITTQYTYPSTSSTNYQNTYPNPTQQNQNTSGMNSQNLTNKYYNPFN
jgi:hypothetical protein